MVGMTDMSEPVNIRQAAANRGKLTLIMGVASVATASLYPWKHNSSDLWIACLWAAVSIFNMFVYRAHKRKLRALDSN
jgi:hypothetical protein